MPGKPDAAGAWLQRLIRWAVLDTWLIWLAILAPLAALVPIFLHYDCEPRLRFTGLVFQLMGMFTVVWGLRDDRRLFGEPTAFQQLKSWLHAFPHTGHSVIPPEIALVVPLAVEETDASLAALAPEATLEKRLARLERITERNRAEIVGLHALVKGMRGKARAAMATERAVRAKAVRDVNAMLREAVAGDLSFDAIGILYFALGTLFGSASIELAPLLFTGRCPGPLSP